MKTSDYVKENSKLNAERINTILPKLSNMSMSQKEWHEALAEEGVLYYIKTVSELIRIGALRMSREKYIGLNNCRYNQYHLSGLKVTCDDLAPMFSEIEEYNKKRADKKRQKRQKEKPKHQRTFSIANHGISVTDSIRLDRLNKLKECSDEELIEEFGRRGFKAWDKLNDKELADRLRERGYEVTAEKVITETIKL